MVCFSILTLNVGLHDDDDEDNDDSYNDKSGLSNRSVVIARHDSPFYGTDKGWYFDNIKLNLAQLI